MREIETQDPGQIRSFYLHFTEVEATPVSSRYAEWADGVAGGDQIQRLT